MKLKSLSIEYSTYGIHEGKFIGQARFENQYGAMEVILAPEMASKVLELCAESLIQQATRSANLFTDAFLNQPPALEDNS